MLSQLILLFFLFLPNINYYFLYFYIKMEGNNSGDEGKNNFNPDEEIGKTPSVKWNFTNLISSSQSWIKNLQGGM